MQAGTGKKGKKVSAEGCMDLASELRRLRRFALCMMRSGWHSLRACCGAASQGGGGFTKALELSDALSEFVGGAREMTRSDLVKLFW